MKFTNLSEEATKQQMKEWSDKMIEADTNFFADDSRRLVDYLRFFVASGMPPEEAMKMAVVLFRPELQEALLFRTKS